MSTETKIEKTKRATEEALSAALKSLGLPVQGKEVDAGGVAI